MWKMVLRTDRTCKMPRVVGNLTAHHLESSIFTLKHGGSIKLKGYSSSGWIGKLLGFNERMVGDESRETLKKKPVGAHKTLEIGTKVDLRGEQQPVANSQSYNVTVCVTSYSCV